MKHNLAYPELRNPLPVQSISNYIIQDACRNSLLHNCNLYVHIIL